MASCYDNVPAPTDANGTVVPLDTKELVRKGETLKVYGFDYSAMLKAWFVKLEEYGYTRLGACTMPDSWERLEEDVNLGCRDYCEKCRLEECDYNMRVHMLARAKKLAGVEKETRND